MKWVMNLFSYDHCPYCVKARMIFGFKKIPFNLITLSNDDEKNPIQMIGKKMLPILEKSQNEFLPESLDIISYVDQLVDFGKPIIKNSESSEDLLVWLREARNYQYHLAMPRWVQMDLEEFKTQAAIDYFTRKKEVTVGSFSANLLRSPHFIEMANKHLESLEKLLSDDEYLGGEDLTLDDFHLFATLRILTTTKAIVFPAKVKRYVNNLSQKSKVSLYWDKAI